MSLRSVQWIDTSGKTLYWFPDASLADWVAKRELAVERTAPDLGIYDAALDVAVSHDWYLFEGSTQPASWADAISNVQLGLYGPLPAPNITTVGPGPLTDDDYLNRYLSAVGIETFGDHDSVTAVLEDCKVYASGLLASMLAARYVWSTLASSPMMQEVWAVVALRTLCYRRGNPPPASLEFRYQEIMQSGGLLEQIVKGRMLLTNANGDPIRMKNSNTPSHANLIIDRFIPEREIRVVTGSSNMTQSKLPRALDRYWSRSIW